MQKCKFIWRLFTVFLLVASVTSCVTPTETAPTPCEGAGGKFTCQGLDGHEITLTDVPEGVVPHLLYVSPEREQDLLKAPTEGTECVFMIAGDLDFYQNGELVKEFPSPITITYAVETQDLEAYAACQTRLVDEKIVEAVEQVDYFPIYFDNNVWKPFNPDNVSIDTQSGMMTIKFTSWGDRPIGGGTQP